MATIHGPDGTGVTADKVGAQIVPSLDLNTMQPLDIWCSTEAELLVHVGALADKQQLVIYELNVTFNSSFSDEPDPKARQMRKEGVTLDRIDASKKPAREQINHLRDSRRGHQLIIYKAGGKAWLYNPDISPTGEHLAEAVEGGGTLAALFSDVPRYEHFAYVHIIGKITPTTKFDENPQSPTPAP